VYSDSSPYASTGSRVYAHDTSDETWGDGIFEYLRIDFVNPVTGVRVDFIANDSSDDNGVLAVYDISENLLGFAVADISGTGNFETLEVLASDISIACLFGDPIGDISDLGSLTPNSGGPDNFVFDHLQYLPVPAADRTLIIKQGSCPAPVNPDSHGLTPMLLVGESEFDVGQVVLASLELSRCDGVGGAITPHEGPPGPGSQIVDLNHPNDSDVGCGDGQVPCTCNADQSSDGIDDLRLRFDTEAMAEAFELHGVVPGMTVTLMLTGELTDGSQFAAADCIRVVGPPEPPGVLLVDASVPNVWVDVTPLDLILDGGGFAAFERAYPLDPHAHGAGVHSWQGVRGVGRQRRAGSLRQPHDAGVRRREHHLGLCPL
jgi:hypothetical protein